MDITLIGFTAAFFTSVAFIPQAVKVIRTNNTDSISLATYAVLCFGVLMWLIYGYLLNDLPMLIANSVTLTFATIILGMKILHVLKNNETAE